MIRDWGSSPGLLLRSDFAKRASCGKIPSRPPGKTGSVGVMEDGLTGPLRRSLARPPQDTTKSPETERSRQRGETAQPGSSLRMSFRNQPRPRTAALDRRIGYETPHPSSVIIPPALIGATSWPAMTGSGKPPHSFSRSSSASRRSPRHHARAVLVPTRLAAQVHRRCSSSASTPASSAPRSSAASASDRRKKPSAAASTS